jgi:hypothetical protein
LCNRLSRHKNHNAAPLKNKNNGKEVKHTRNEGEDQEALNEFQEFARTVRGLKALLSPLAGVLFIAIRLTQIILFFTGAANR